ncbi:MAG: phosphatase PAP2 family protein [Tannerella sp.]|jgi:membrane-associated phospholipid phosphatase|nr:phosphatase PAP2 family protein [Tannerella sp.]
MQSSIMKMKVTVMFLLVVSKISAQEADTVRIRSMEKLKSNVKIESLLPRIHSRNPFSVLPYDERTNTYSSKFNEAYLFNMHWKGRKRNNNIFNAPYSKFIIPATLIAYGVTSQFDRSDDYEIRDEVIKNGIGAYTIDDYSQFAPAVAVYGLDLTGIKARHNFRDRTIIMATSHLILGGIVQTMKNSIPVERPDGSNYKSFPSGHTATAFVGAHILFKEYKDTSPWIGVAGYAVATGTGLLRVTNKKHWLSDVSAGAGTGILSAELGYLLLPVIHKAFGTGKRGKSSSLAIAPTIGLNNYGLGLAYTF